MEDIKVWDNNAKEHGEFFKSLITLNRSKVIVEVGVALAATTKYLCEGAATNGATVFGYDLWDIHGLNNQFHALSTKENCENYLKENDLHNFELTQINSKTTEFKELIQSKHTVIDFAFIDGCHSYEGVKNDFDVIYPLLSQSGVIAFHDTLRIDGCREFIIDLRTKYNDGTFDIMDIPFGNNDRRVGITMLTKRSFQTLGLGIDEICGSPSTPDEIYEKEQNWYNSEINKD